jgi:hypothetical protein
MIKILERLDQEKGFEFERAFVRVHDNRTYAMGVFGGVECFIETKPSLLEAGIASCIPEDSWSWPVSLRVSVNGQEQLLEECTADERAVAAAKKYHELLLSGDIEKIEDGTPL